MLKNFCPLVIWMSKEELLVLPLKLSLIAGSMDFKSALMTLLWEFLTLVPINRDLGMLV